MTVYLPKEDSNTVFLGKLELHSPEWHDTRAKGIGGSEIGTIMGLNLWESAYALWAKKCGLIPDERSDNWSMRLGRVLESPILSIWQEDNPDWKLLDTGTYADKSNPWRIANPDAIAQHKKTKELMVIEVKTARMGWAETPPAYRSQLLWYMDILDIKRGVIIAIAGWNWEQREIEFDQFEVDVMRTMASKFWEKVQLINKPDWDGSDHTYEVVRKMHPQIDGTTAEIGSLADELSIANAEFEEAKSKLNKIRSQVLDAMGSSQYAVKDLAEPEKVVASRQARGTSAPWLVVKG